MKIMEPEMRRRTLLKGAAIAAVAWMARPTLRRAHAQQPSVAITALSVDRAPTDPDDPIWPGIVAAPIPLKPQDRVLPRLTEAGTTSVDVAAVYDADRLSILIEWRDAHKDADLGTVMQYRDGVAVMFPEDPAAGATSVMMGMRGKGVVIYHWKADWQFGRLHDVDEAYPNMYGDWYQGSGVDAGQMPEATDYLSAGRPEFLTAAAVANDLADPRAQERIGPVQKMRAEGFGTIEPDDVQDALGLGVWKDGEWRIVISMPRKQAGFTWEEGFPLPLALAVWDGSRNERNGQKAFSEWQEMSLGPVAALPLPVTPEEEGRGFLLPLFGGVGGAMAAAIAAIIGLRMRRARAGQEEADSKE